MNSAVKAIQTSACFPLTKQYYNFPPPSRFRGRSSCLLCLCNNNSGDSESAGEGDRRKQELLARIAMLQTQKVRLTDFLDERSEYLTQFAEDANAEFDKIGENALKELDQAGDRIMEKLEGRMQDFEESSDVSREEIEKSERVLEEFEDQIVRDRNEGLFFKNLRDQKPPTPTPAAAAAEAKVEAEKISEITKDNIAGSKLRKNIYLGFMSLLAITIGNAIFATDHVEWRKVAALGFIFMGLLSQFIYEQSLSSSSSSSSSSSKEIDKKEK
ncbi:uncharacterized protein M6B38_135040 [Iris pallida]|uniref:Uncharacterized protein n=1 Tax=Iris pallida TaxID=29817 RepID=A0AAX6FFA5_IRIPA|nr:uncharacterized protein M6B38_135040 [Iris pallida]